VFQTIIIGGGLLSGLLAMVLGGGSLFPAGNDGQVPPDQKPSFNSATVTARSGEPGEEKEEMGR
jgi:hypothetical protein